MTASLHQHPGQKRMRHVVLACCVLFVGALFNRAQAGTTLSILTLGDSLTYGLSNSNGSVVPGGYRDPLYSLLLNSGVSTTYVGVGNGNPSTVLSNAGQTANDGFNGYTINQIDENLAANVQPAGTTSNLGGNWLTTPGQQANIVLLMAGTNDIALSDPSLTTDQIAAEITSNLQTLITDVHKDEPNAAIFVASPPPLILFNKWTLDGQQLNLDISNLIATQFANKNIYFVDMNDAINQYGDYAGGDGTHLTQQGYDAMADTWFDAITTDLNVADVPEPSTYALFIGGVVALAGWRRLRTRKA